MSSDASVSVDCCKWSAGHRADLECNSRVAVSSIEACGDHRYIRSSEQCDEGCDGLTSYDFLFVYSITEMSCLETRYVSKPECWSWCRSEGFGLGLNLGFGYFRLGIAAVRCRRTSLLCGGQRAGQGEASAA